ncbi:MAG TPA: ATP-binding protein [Aquabacterium sp.]|nr:ATP-binding protein [Aquabacterium sp.]
MPQTLLSRRAVQDEQLRTIWAHARIGALVATAFAVAIALCMRKDLGAPHVVDAWLVAKFAIAAFRWLQGWDAPRHTPGPTSTLAGLVIDGSVWGIAGLYVATSAPWPLASFVIASLAGVSCVATFGLQFSAPYTAGYVVPILAPTALGMFMRGEPLGFLGGLGLLMLLGLQLITAARTEQRLKDTILLRMQAEALAQEKDEALRTAMRQSAVKTQFLANMSHELRTPLHGILGMARLLHMDVRDAGLRRRIELIQSSGSHLLGLINDLLDISRIESGQFLLRNERYDLHAQIEQLAGIYAVRAEEKGLHFLVHHRLSAPCWVLGDPARFRQVLHNLLGNAIKFTRQGSIELKVERDEDQGMVWTEVRDTGVGIGRQELPTIFEAFQQAASASGTHSAEGVGLGLTIARDIARAMGGDITADSEPGVGTTMTFSAFLPGTQAPQESEPVNTPSSEARAAELANPNAAISATETEPATCLVLMAEDNDINALVATNFLEIIGARTERVKDGREAVRHALRDINRPDLILMDCDMPIMDGYEATREIRTQEQQLALPRIPIVALTATAGDSERQDCLDAGMDDFLSKPCVLEDLSKVLQRWSHLRVRPPVPDNPSDAVSADSPARGPERIQA